MAIACLAELCELSTWTLGVDSKRHLKSITGLINSGNRSSLTTYGNSVSRKLSSRTPTIGPKRRPLHIMHKTLSQQEFILILLHTCPYLAGQQTCQLSLSALWPWVPFVQYHSHRQVNLVLAAYDCECHNFEDVLDDASTSRRWCVLVALLIFVQQSGNCPLSIIIDFFAFSDWVFRARQCR